MSFASPYLILRHLEDFSSERSLDFSENQGIPIEPNSAETQPRVLAHRAQVVIELPCTLVSCAHLDA